MDYTSRRELLKTLETRFGNRCKSHGEHSGPLATVSPIDAGEVEFLAQTARQYSVKLTPAGAGIDPDLPEPAEDAVLVSTEMMRGVRFPDAGRAAVEVEAGALWGELEDEPRSSHRALTVYPTSVPRSTVGGWLARDGMGVGSFANGWMRENVLSAGVIPPDGRLRTFEGDELGLVVGAMGKTGVIAWATLKLRETKGDTPYAAAFAGAEALQRAIDSLLERRPPLWHLGFMNPPMARAVRARAAPDLWRIPGERRRSGRKRDRPDVEREPRRVARRRRDSRTLGRQVLPRRPRPPDAGSGPGARARFAGRDDTRPPRKRP